MVGLVAAMLAAPAGAQGIRIHMHADDGYAADGVFYAPAGNPPFAAMLLIPDERGLTRRVIETAASFAQAGYVTVAVDLNRGLSAQAAAHSDLEARHDLAAALAYVARQSTVRAHDVGAVGWGSGGSYALELAGASSVRAVVLIDTPLPRDVSVLDAVHVPVLAIIAGRDASVPRSTLKALEERGRAVGSLVDAEIYREADAGFDDPDDAAHFRVSDADDARRRTQKFLATYLDR